VSRENVEIVRSILAAWADGDVERVVAAIAEDGELIPLRAQLEGTSYRGREGVRRFWDDLHADWQDLEVSVDEFRDLGDRVLTLGRFKALGRASGVDLDVPIAQLWELRDGMVVHMHAYSDPADALRAAGLDE
jgi:ketosteroid isomerase-like protein